MCKSRQSRHINKMHTHNALRSHQFYPQYHMPSPNSTSAFKSPNLAESSLDSISSGKSTPGFLNIDSPRKHHKDRRGADRSTNSSLDMLQDRSFPGSPRRQVDTRPLPAVPVHDGSPLSQSGDQGGNNGGRQAETPRPPQLRRMDNHHHGNNKHPKAGNHGSSGRADHSKAYSRVHHPHPHHGNHSRGYSGSDSRSNIGSDGQIAKEEVKGTLSRKQANQRDVQQAVVGKSTHALVATFEERQRQRKHRELPRSPQDVSMSIAHPSSEGSAMSGKGKGQGKHSDNVSQDRVINSDNDPRSPRPGSSPPSPNRSNTLPTKLTPVLEHKGIRHPQGVRIPHPYPQATTPFLSPRKQHSSDEQLSSDNERPPPIPPKSPLILTPQSPVNMKAWKSSSSINTEHSTATGDTDAIYQCLKKIANSYSKSLTRGKHCCKHCTVIPLFHNTDIEARIHSGSYIQSGRQ